MTILLSFRFFLPQLLYVSFLLVGYSSLAQQPDLKIISPEQAKEDLELLKEVLEAIHPSLYLHQTKKEWEQLHDTIYNRIDIPMNSKDFIDMVSPLVRSIRCGHTQLRLEEDLVNWSTTKLLPFYGSYLNRELYVGNSLDSILPAEAVIRSIDDESSSTLIHKIVNSALLNSDGYDDRFIYGAFQNKNFHLFYNYFYPDKDSVQLIFSIGKTIDTIQVATITLDSFQNYEGNKNKITTINDSIFLSLSEQDTLDWSPIYFEHKKFKVRIKTILVASLYQHKRKKEVARLSLSGFQNGQLKFYKWLFPKLKSIGIKHLILDLRGNLGGSVRSAKHILEYLVDSSYQITFHEKRYKRNIKNRLRKSFLFYAKMQLDLRSQVKTKRKNGEKYFELKIKPKKKYHFEESLYCLLYTSPSPRDATLSRMPSSA